MEYDTAQKEPASTVTVATATEMTGETLILTNDEILREIKKEMDMDYEEYDSQNSEENAATTDPTTPIISHATSLQPQVATPPTATSTPTRAWHHVAAKSTSKPSQSQRSNTVTTVIYPSQLTQFQKARVVQKAPVQVKKPVAAVVVQPPTPKQQKPQKLSPDQVAQLHNKKTESSFQESLLKKTTVPLTRNNIRIRRLSVANPKFSRSADSVDSVKSENIVYDGDNTDKPWCCKACGRTYKWKNSLKCHIKNECGVPPKYHCARKCGYKTHIHSNLKRHLNSKFCKPPDIRSAP